MEDVEAELIHEMKNTATVLQQAASQLREDRDSMSPEMVSHMFEMLTRRSDMLVRLLEDLSTAHLATRGELAVSLQAVSLTEVCHGLVTERESAVAERLTIEVGENTSVIADPLRLSQVLDNLVTNALRYGGPSVHLRAEQDGSNVRLSVSDDGAGVPAELMPHLFEAYARGPMSSGFGGSGLGLLITRQLCAAMGGSVEYDNTDGARFTVTLPALPVASPTLRSHRVPPGHSVAFWTAPDDLVKRLIPYVTDGLAAGEAVVVAATLAHHRLLRTGLIESGLDPDATAASGQLIIFDADELHRELAQTDHIDRERFDELISAKVEAASRRWQGFRVYGEIVDLYWRRGDFHLSLELEACWNDLRTRVSFPLLCGYRLTPDADMGRIFGCHDALVA